MRILVVDDDPVIQRLLQVNFELEGYEVILAGDGEAGLAAARSERPDCLVLDVMMPKMNGLQVAAALKGSETTAGIPIILLSAKAQDVDVEAGEGSGADRYVTKPFDPLELLAVVSELVPERS
jgi:DNA-binding response OmpR family regulator